MSAKRAETCVELDHAQRERQLYDRADAADREKSADFGRSDFALSLGVFCHLFNPIAVLQHLSEVTDKALVLVTTCRMSSPP
jgi:hypothetical protein